MALILQCLCFLCPSFHQNSNVSSFPCPVQQSHTMHLYIPHQDSRPSQMPCICYACAQCRLQGARDHGVNHDQGRLSFTPNLARQSLEIFGHCNAPSLGHSHAGFTMIWRSTTFDPMPELKSSCKAVDCHCLDMWYVRGDLPRVAMTCIATPQKMEKRFQNGIEIL